MKQITAAILTIFVVPIASAAIPIIEFPIGAVPKNTKVYTLIALPRMLSETESCIKLFAVAKKLNILHPMNISKAIER